MIIPDDQIDKKVPAPPPVATTVNPVVTAYNQTNTYVDGITQNDDRPPPYTASTSGIPPASPPSTGGDSAQRPCNWMYMRRTNGAIKESYIVDPTLQIPSSLLSDAATSIPEYQRDNLNLNTSNGSLDVTLSIIGGAVLVERKRRAKISLNTSNGSVKVKMNQTEDTMPRFVVQATTSNGSVHIRIPRSFTGPISASTSWGSISLSSELEKQSTTFSDGNVKKCFVGDFSKYEEDKKEEWDELVLKTNHGSIRIEYSDEDWCSSAGKSGGKGFWGRVFGL